MVNRLFKVIFGVLFFPVFMIIGAVGILVAALMSGAAYIITGEDRSEQYTLIGGKLYDLYFEIFN